MLDEPFGVGIVFAPQMNKLGKMVGTKDGPISCEVVKVVHDDSNEEIEHEKAGEGKIWILVVGSFRGDFDIKLSIEASEDDYLLSKC